jgi:Zn-finger nucleic acid-binding protein
MAKCSSCSAPLLANTQYCRYCGVRNDVDLQGKHDYSIVGADSGRICPECREPLQTVALNDGALHIERCRSCFGLFFDPGEIETLLDSAVSPVFSVNIELLTSINQDRYAKDKPVKYHECPVCQTLMNRVLFGHRSGVVIDQCKSHGVWLNGGEISHLLEWKKAGGQMLHEQKAKERQKETKRKRSEASAEINPITLDYGKQSSDTALLETVAGVLFKIFE